MRDLRSENSVRKLSRHTQISTTSSIFLTHGAGAVAKNKAEPSSSVSW